MPERKADIHPRSSEICLRQMHPGGHSECLLALWSAIAPPQVRKKGAPSVNETSYILGFADVRSDGFNSHYVGGQQLVRELLKLRNFRLRDFREHLRFFPQRFGLLSILGKRRACLWRTTTEA